MFESHSGSKQEVGIIHTLLYPSVTRAQPFNSPSAIRLNENKRNPTLGPFCEMTEIENDFKLYHIFHTKCNAYKKIPSFFVLFALKWHL